jgi:hypothetical protein
MGWRPARLELSRRGNVIPNLLAIVGTLATHGGEEVNRVRERDPK